MSSTHPTWLVEKIVLITLRAKSVLVHVTLFHFDVVEKALSTLTALLLSGTTAYDEHEIFHRYQSVHDFHSLTHYVSDRLSLAHHVRSPFTSFFSVYLKREKKGHTIVGDCALFCIFIITSVWLSSIVGDEKKNPLQQICTKRRRAKEKRKNNIFVCTLIRTFFWIFDGIHCWNTHQQSSRSRFLYQRKK